MNEDTHLYIPITGAIFIVTCAIFYFGYHLHLETLGQLSSYNILAIFIYLILGFTSAVVGYVCSSGLIIYPEFVYANEKSSNTLLKSVFNPTNLNTALILIGNICPYVIGINIATNAVYGF